MSLTCSWWTSSICESFLLGQVFQRGHSKSLAWLCVSGCQNSGKGRGEGRKESEELIVQDADIGTSLVAQWLRIRLPMQGTQVRALVQEDPTCRGATKPVRHNYWARKPRLLKPLRASSPFSATREATAVRSPRTSMKKSSRSPQLEKAHMQQ